MRNNSKELSTGPVVPVVMDGVVSIGVYPR